MVYEVRERNATFKMECKGDKPRTNKRKGSSTESVPQKKQRIKNVCHTCSTAKGLVHISTHIAPSDKTLRRELSGNLARIFKKQLTYVRGGGREERCSNKNLNLSFMNDFFPNAFHKSYRWPLRFNFENSSYSSHELRNSNRYKPMWDKRRGDEAEHKTFYMLAEMFEQKNIPSFIISGYEWTKMFPKEVLGVLADKIREGESDILIFLPNKGVFAFEVKSKTIKEEDGSSKQVMRMSTTNLDFVNHWLGKKYRIGHSIGGILPEVYKMECICGELPLADVHNCTPILIAKLFERISRELEQAEKANNNHIDVKDLVIMTREHAAVKKLLSKWKINVMVRPAAYFTGCDTKIAVIDFRHLCNMGDTLTEAVTRATSRLILLDVACTRENCETEIFKMFHSLNEKMESMGNQGLLRIVPQVPLEESEKQILRHELSLGLFRDEDEVKQNMAKVVTVEKLEMALNAKMAPVQEGILNINNSLAKICTALDIS